MAVKLLTEHHLEFLSLKGGCTGSSRSTFGEGPKGQISLNIIKFQLQCQKIFLRNSTRFGVFVYTCIEKS